MTITIKEKGSDAFYREVLGIYANYRYLLKNHRRKIKDPIKEYTLLLIIGAVAFALLLVCTFIFGVGIFEGIALTGLFLAAVLSALLLFRLIKTKNAMLADPRTSTLTLNDDGVNLNKENTQELRVSWDGIVFVRVQKEGVYFVTAEQTGIVISVIRKYENEILSWLKHERPGLEIITAA